MTAEAFPAESTLFEVKLPQWGMGMEEGSIIEWYKKPGDSVAQGEPLALIEAAKTETDLLSPVAGVVAELRAEAGEFVAVQAVLAVLAVAQPL
jgi:pyruvate/2-oxoglutarate dehydrogenase complex dihydrolipoamide acyltransferase (E2) component